MRQACPRCGGSEVRQITPGYFECQSFVLDGVIPPTPGNPAPTPAHRVCGYRFQVSSNPTELCACGRQSIGNCQDCARPLCGLHGTQAGLFLCAACVAARREREVRDQAAASAKEAPERETANEILRTSPDPAELVRVITTYAARALTRSACQQAWARLAASGYIEPNCALVTLLGLARTPVAR